ncbi:MAG: decarboxylating 6-phosphogluconate dehydrogenase [Phycisphaerales bacterium]|jgi:6-phosphogluconate dehydrogenase|nr:decarboxylating 6-phosphogluconate dehydrogenase [Phycisphaerales bacterium]
MQVAMIGLGRMGGGMVRRLLADGHECVVWDVNADAVATLASEGAVGVDSLESLAAAMSGPRAVWMMVPAGLVDRVIADVSPHLSSGDVLVDGGNSMWRDDLRRHGELGERGIRYVDAGVSGGVWGRERGYCLMVGGDHDAVGHLKPALASLAPGIEAAPRTPGRSDPPSTAESGWLHCGPSGAGHFVKMVHNGIEYGLMAAYAEGLGVLAHAGAGRTDQEHDAETTPLRTPEAFQYDLDLQSITELWRRGSVIGSWLLDLTAAALQEDPQLDAFAGRVSDSGEGRWTLQAAVETGAPAPVLAAALFQRFASRGEDEFGRRVLSAMRSQFGGHSEKSE